MPRLPPLTALRVLEAIGDTGSITAAASRLNVSHSAISFQIKVLEQESPVPIFVRHGRATMLTDAGRSLAQTIHQAFEMIRHEMDRLPMRSMGSVSISAMPIIATQWLIPRLPRLARDHPRVRVHLGLALSDRPAKPTPDIQIHFEKRELLRVGDQPLLSGRAAPVCAPEILAAHCERGDALFETVPLIQEEDLRMWDTWFAKSGVKRVGLRAMDQVVITDSSVSRAAALAGLGLAFGRLELIAPDLHSGSLVKASDVEIDEDYCYFVRVTKQASLRPDVVTVVEWLTKEASEDTRPFSVKARADQHGIDKLSTTVSG
jgi:DNA-binding transcriptional LysR family regulator